MHTEATGLLVHGQRSPLSLWDGGAFVLARLAAAWCKSEFTLCILSLTVVNNLGMLLPGGRAINCPP